MEYLTASELRQKARESLKDRWGMAVLVFFIAAILVNGVSIVWRFSSDFPIIVEQGIDAYIEAKNAGEYGGSSLSISVLNLVFGGPIGFGTALVALKFLEKKNVEVKGLFVGFNDFKRLFVLNLLQSIFIALWTLLLIVPGIIKSYAYRMAYYVAIDHPELSARECLDRSQELMMGKKWRLFCLDLSFIGWGFLAGLTFGIGMLWLNPYIKVSEGAFYQMVCEENGNGKAEKGEASVTEERDDTFGSADDVVFKSETEEKKPEDDTASKLDNESWDIFNNGNNDKKD